MRKQKEADCWQQSAGGLDCPPQGFSWPTSIIPQPGDDFKSAVRDYFESVGVVVTITETDGVPAHPVLSPSRLCVLRGAGVSPPSGAAGGALGRGVARRGRVPSPTLLIDNRPTPPSGNTGVMDTSGCVVDWLSATLKGCSIPEGLEVVRDLFGPITELGRGFRGYANSGVILGTGRVAWDYDRPDMGVHVDLPGSALGELRRSITDFEGMLRFMVDVGFVFTRCDSAVDDRDGVLDVATIRKAVESGDYASRWHKASRTYNLRGAGDTIYLGAPTSDSRLRIYDKAAEQGLEGVHWVRVELQFRRGLAHAMVLRLVEDGPDVVLSVLRGCVDFKEPGGDSNVARRRSASWWVRFLRAREKLRLVLPRVAQTLEGVRRWIEHQVAPSLALLVKAEGGALDWLISVIHEGERRLTPQRLALLPVDV